jgi:flagellar motor switch protein FliG
VLSYLAPARAAQVLAALPDRLQAETVERLSVLGDTDPKSLQVLERELADWVERQRATRARITQRSGTVDAILAAADQQARDEILGNLLKHNRSLAQQFTAVSSRHNEQPTIIASGSGQKVSETPDSLASGLPSRAPQSRPQLPQIHIDDLARMDKASLAAVLRTMDPEILVLALAGASDALVERITEEMPRKVAKTFRRKLNCNGPMRLRDIEAAQQAVVAAAAEILHARRVQRNALAA